MKLKRLFVALLSVCLVSCGDESGTTTYDDFTFHNDNVKITDTLSKVENEKAHIVFLFGQSNADGVSYNEYLEKNNKTIYDEYNSGYENVMINFVNDNYNTSSNGEFIRCKLGQGCAPICFGPEMGIAEKIHNKYKDEKTFIIKWTWGGTTLKTQWLDGHFNRGDLYNSSMDFSLKCLDYLKGKGYQLSLDGICWMQGENDSGYRSQLTYYNCTNAYVSLMRHDLKKYQSEIRFVDAGINEIDDVWVKANLINGAKKQFADTSDLNFYIDSKELGLTSKAEPEGKVDLAHFDSFSMVKLGQAFGEVVAQ